MEEFDICATPCPYTPPHVVRLTRQGNPPGHARPEFAYHDFQEILPGFSGPTCKAYSKLFPRMPRGTEQVRVDGVGNEPTVPRMVPLIGLHNFEALGVDRNDILECREKGGLCFIRYDFGRRGKNGVICQ